MTASNLENESINFVVENAGYFASAGSIVCVCAIAEKESTEVLNGT
jgi:hypothetical protein